MKHKPLNMCILSLLLAVITNAPISYGQQTDKLKRPILIKDGQTSQTFFRTEPAVVFGHPPYKIRVELGTDTASLLYLSPMNSTREQQNVTLTPASDLFKYMGVLLLLFVVSFVVYATILWLQGNSDRGIIFVYFVISSSIAITVAMVLVFGYFLIFNHNTIYFDNATDTSYVLRLKETDIHVPANAHVPVKLKSGLHTIEILNEHGHLVVPNTTIELESSGVHIYNIQGTNTYTVIQAHYR